MAGGGGGPLPSPPKIHNLLKLNRKTEKQNSLVLILKNEKIL